MTDADGNIAQHVEYIPYGEIFVEERNNQFSTNYLFNAKELDNETGLYYYGARYLDPTGAMWLSVDPMWEKYAGMSPYNYCAGNPVKLVDPDGREGVKSEENGQKYVEANVIITLEKQREVSENMSPLKIKYRNWKNKKIEHRNSTFKSAIMEDLNREYNGPNNEGSLNSKGERVKFKFNFIDFYLSGDDLEYPNEDAYDEILREYKITSSDVQATDPKTGAVVYKKAKPAIFTQWKLPPLEEDVNKSGGKTRNRTYIFRSRYRLANCHELLHTFGLPDNGYDKGGLLNSPIMPILPSEVDDIWNNCLNK